MNNIEKDIKKEFIMARLETLESRLRDNVEFQQQKKISHDAGIKFREACRMESEIWEKYCEYETELMKTNCIIYGEEAYRMGIDDALQMAAEQQIKTRKSVLSVDDMEHMVYLYDIAKKIKTLFCGKGETCHAESGAMKDFHRIFRVIESGVCSEIAMLGDDEAIDIIVDVLENEEMFPEEKARILTGLQETSIR